MHLHHGVPLIRGGVGEHAIANDAGVVEHDVEPAERLDGHVHQALGTLDRGHVVAVDDALAAGGGDLVHDLLRRRQRTAGAVGLGADVVDHDLRTLGGEGEGVCPTESTPGAGHDHYPSVTDAAHRSPQSHCRKVVGTCAPNVSDDSFATNLTGCQIRAPVTRVLSHALRGDDLRDRPGDAR